MKTRTILAIVAALLALAAPAGARTRHHHHRHYARHRVVCRASYRRELVRVKKRVKHHHRWVAVRRHHRVVWVKRARCVRVKPKHAATKPTSTVPAPLPTRTLHYSSSVDPTFTQDPTNPLRVTYSFSADTTQTVNGVTVDLAATGQLPLGVLNLYTTSVPGAPASPIGIGLPPSGESLICAINIGGTVAGGSCPITYDQTGTYQVTTQAIWSTTNSVTSTEAETISPYSTTTTISSTSSNGTTDYSLAVVDQNGNAVQPGMGGSYTITDTTTGRVVGSLPADPAGGPSTFHFGVRNVGGAGEVDIWEGQDYTGPVNTSDSFSIQGTYQPSPGIGWTGSSSQAVPLVLSGS